MDKQEWVKFRDNHIISEVEKILIGMKNAKGFTIIFASGGLWLVHNGRRIGHNLMQHVNPEKRIDTKEWINYEEMTTAIAVMTSGHNIL